MLPKNVGDKEIFKSLFLQAFFQPLIASPKDGIQFKGQGYMRSISFVNIMA